MSTAHRPTWNPRQASAEAIGAGTKAPPTYKSSERDLPGHTKLRNRRLPQAEPEEAVDEELLQLSYHNDHTDHTDHNDHNDGDESFTSEEEEEVEEEALQAELAKVRAEREAQVAQVRSQIESAKPKDSAGWLDDAPFHAKQPPPASKPAFINDATRSDYHKQFMNKFIR